MSKQSLVSTLLWQWFYRQPSLVLGRQVSSLKWSTFKESDGLIPEQSKALMSKVLRQRSKLYVLNGVTSGLPGSHAACNACMDLVEAIKKLSLNQDDALNAKPKAKAMPRRVNA